MVRKTGYHIAYSTITEDNVIKNSQDIEKNTWILKGNDPNGPFVMGFDSLPWDKNSTIRTAKNVIIIAIIKIIIMVIIKIIMKVTIIKLIVTITMMIMIKITTITTTKRIKITTKTIR